MSATHPSATAAFMRALDDIEDGVAYFDVDLRLATWNSAFETQCARDRLPLHPGMSLADTGIVGLDAGSFALQAPGQRRQIDIIDGRGRSIRLKLARTDDGGLICTGVDISDLKVTARRAGDTHSFLSAILDYVPAQLAVKDLDGRYIVANQAFMKETGKTREELLGYTVAEVFSVELASELQARDLEAVQHPGRMTDVTRAVHIPGAGLRHVRAKVVCLPPMDGETYIVTVNEDVTDQLADQAKLKQALNDAEAANAAKSAFLAIMSHEIRTPLNGVLGMAQVMALDQLSPIQRDRVEVIRQSGATLLAILNDILDLSKIEAGKLELEIIEFEIEELAKGAHAAFTALANKKGISFVLTIETAARGVYRGDSTRLRQVLYNLISNALKFTDHGHVQVVISPIEAGLRLRVSDTGIGIAPDRLERLFDKFVQGDVSMTRRYGGTGLGLAVCRELVELMGGTIEVSSQAGQGAAFCVDVPLPRVGDAGSSAIVSYEADAGRNAARELEGGALRVLAAEDNPVNQLVLKTLLHQFGITPMVVNNGLEAVEAWRGQSWDLVLMDMQMPQMDGLSAGREIRRLEQALGLARTPMVALTANVMSYQTAEYAAAGFDGFVAKPIEIERLFDVLQQVGGTDDDSPSAAA